MKAFRTIGAFMVLALISAIAVPASAHEVSPIFSIEEPTIFGLGMNDAFGIGLISAAIVMAIVTLLYSWIVAAPERETILKNEARRQEAKAMAEFHEDLARREVRSPGG